MRWVRGKNELKKPLGCSASRVIEEEQRDEGYEEVVRSHDRTGTATWRFGRDYYEYFKDDGTRIPRDRDWQRVNGDYEKGSSSATIRERDYEHRNLDNGVRRNYDNGRRSWDRYSQLSDGIDSRYGESSIPNRGVDDSKAREDDDYNNWCRSNLGLFNNIYGDDPFDDVSGARPDYDSTYRLYGDTTSNDFNKHNKLSLYDDASPLNKGYENGNADYDKDTYQSRLWFASKAYPNNHYDNGSNDNVGVQLNNDNRDRNGGYEVKQPNGMIVKRTIAPDNSCLFNAIGYALFHSRDHGQTLRRAVALIVEEDPEKFNDAILDMPNAEYRKWICNPNTWGGGIELEILGKLFHCEIATYDVSTGKPILHAEGRGYEQRILLLYDGSHYDALALVPNTRAPEIVDQTIFSIDKDHTLGDVEQLIKNYFRERYWR